MRSLSTITSKGRNGLKVLEDSEKLSIYYHDLFDYPLTFADLIKWNASENFSVNYHEIAVVCQNNYYFLRGREGLVYKRALRSRISAKKMEIAHKTSQVLSLIPGVKMVAVTGSLAMENAIDESDIDLMVITKKGLLWTTRIFAYLLICLFGIRTRRPFDRNQKDKLCLNMWMDETDLEWKRNDRNFYTAHEIAQILPLVNKNGAYEKFLRKNVWVLKFWPNAARISTPSRGSHLESRIWKEKKTRFYILNSIFSLVEKICYKIQYSHMKSKITREVITPTRAIFHPQDWGKVIVERLAS